MRTKAIFKDIKKILFLIPYILIVSISDIVLAEPDNSVLSDILWYHIFGRLTAGEVQTLIMSMESIGAIFLFALLFGNTISSFFGSVSTFVFTRLQNRKLWIRKKLLTLCGFAAIYTALFTAMELLIASRRVLTWSFDKTLVFTLLTIFGALFPLLAVICILVNWLSIRHGIPIGVFTVFVAIMILEVIAIIFFDNPLNMIVNPVCFNIQILESLPLTCLKLLIEFFYLIVVSLGMTFDIQNMDIF